jgi:hypothetical protein
MANPTTNFGWQMPTNSDLVTDLPADFEVFGQAVDTTLVDLKGGTTGQVLSKASNTDMDFTWVAQDDSNAIQNAIVDAKGDLISATAADTPARLAVGTNGQVLTADSTQATGLSWATPSSGSMTLLTSGSLPTGASTITLSSISQSYKNLRLIIKKMQNSTDATNFNMRWNGSSSAIYDWGWDTGVATMAQTFIRLMTNIDNTTQDGFTLIDIPDYANTTTYKWCLVYGWNTNTTTTSVNRNMYMGGNNSTSAISSITIYGESGTNFDAGTYELYGVN